MKLKRYQANEPQAYHFESSECYCDLLAIEKAEKVTRQARKWDENSLQQLAAIVRLEKLRNQLAANQVTLEEYRRTLEAEVRSCFTRTGSGVFSNLPIHEIFYAELNKEYQ